MDRTSEQDRVDEYNSQRGDLTGYQCAACRNRGNYAVLVDGVMTMQQCKCIEVRRCIRLMKDSGINSSYTLQNFKASSDWQRSLLAAANRFLLSADCWFFAGGQVGCVDADTEYFDGTAWRKISWYNGGNVLQYNPETKEASLTKPLRYIEKPADVLYKITNKTGSIDQVLSADHNFAYITSKGHMRKKPFSEIMKQHEETVQGFYGKIETTFHFNGSGISLTDNELRIMCAVIADGSFRKKVRFCTVNLKKQRKIERLRMLLMQQELEYKEYRKSNGYTEFRFYAPIKTKEFTSEWYKCSNKQLRIIANEAFLWDGHRDDTGRETFFTTNKANADFIQFAIFATGSRSTIGYDDHKEKRCYVVNRVKKLSRVSLASTNGKNKIPIEKFIPNDGKQYCFTVPTGYLVLRRNNRIFITGNCGKTHICTGIVRELLQKGVPARYMLWRDAAVKIKAVVGKPEEYAALVDPLKTIDVLYIDDFLKSNSDPTPADFNLAFEIINARYNRKLVTLISSEYFLDEITEMDEAVGSRIYERSAGCLVNIGRDSRRNYRLREVQRI